MKNGEILRPWLKYYSEEVQKSKVPEKTVYRAVYDNNSCYPTGIALNYLGKIKITYDEFFRKIDDTARALLDIGVKTGDIVTLLMPTTPETIYLFYALSKIGAVANMVDPRTSAKGITTYLNEVKSKLVFSMDLFIEKTDEAIKGTNVENVVSISPFDSLPAGIKTIAGAKDILNKDRRKINKILNDKWYIYVKWPDFIKKASLEVENNFEVPFKKDAPLLIVHTGGTTGPSKGVVLSNYACNTLAHQYATCGIRMVRGQKFMDIMPPFIAYGIVDGINMPIYCGVTDIIYPEVKPENLDRMIIKNKPNHFMGAPTHYEYLMRSNKLSKKKNWDLSNIISAGVGGDNIPKKNEEKVNHYFNIHNCEYGLAKGYGMTELSSCAVTTVGKTNKLGSVGIPLPGNDVGIFDPKTHEYLGIKKEGEICVSSAAMMLEYHDNDEETNHVIRTHDDGRRWVHSGDIGYIDEDGFLFVKGRIKEIIIRFDGFKVSPLVIENAILTHPDVKSCKVVGIDNKNHSQGEVPIANIVLKDGVKDIKKIESELALICTCELPEYIIPYDFKFVDELPLTPIGKIDFVKLAIIDSKQVTFDGNDNPKVLRRK